MKQLTSSQDCLCCDRLSFYCFVKSLVKLQGSLLLLFASAKTLDGTDKADRKEKGFNAIALKSFNLRSASIRRYAADAFSINAVIPTKEILLKQS